MAKEVIMPALGMAQDEGVLLRWLKKEGEMVTAGEPLMEVATDKVDVQVDAPASGLLTAVTAKEGDEIPVGQVIAQIAAEGEELPAPQQASDPVEASVGDRRADLPLPSSPVAARIAAEHGINLAEVSAAGGRISKEDVEAHIRAADSGARVLASPKARRLARERGIDLATLVGHGPGGAVLAADVPQTAQPQTESLPQPVPEVAATTDRAPAAMEPETQPVSRMWQIMAQRLTAELEQRAALLPGAGSERSPAHRLANPTCPRRHRRGQDHLHRHAHEAGSALSGPLPPLELLLGRRQNRHQSGHQRRLGHSCRRRFACAGST